MSDCSSLVTSDGNNKVKVQLLIDCLHVGFLYKFMTIKIILFPTNLALLWLFEGVKTRGNGGLL